MAGAAIGAGLVAGMKATAQPVKEAAVDFFDNVASSEHVFNKYPETAHFVQDFKAYAQEVHSKADTELNQVILQHQQAAAAGHPLPKIDKGAVYAKHASAARDKIFGPNDIVPVATAVGLENKYGKSAAQLFSDTYAYMVKDRMGIMKHPVTGEPGAFVSEMKMRARKAGVDIDAKATYTPHSKIEQGAQAVTNAALIPLLAIQHTATVFNGLFGAEPSTWAKGLIDSVSSGIGRNSNDWDLLVQSGVMTDHLMREVDYYNKFQASDRTFQFPGDSAVGQVYKMFHQPGFGPQRTLWTASQANVGRMVGEEAALTYAKNPHDVTALWQLKELGLDPQKILSQQGRLAQDDVEKAMFAFTDKHVFLDNNLQRSRLLSATPMGRMLGMYHSYVVRQGKLMYRAMFKDFKERGAASVVRNLAIGSMLYPMLGEGVKIVGEGIRGQNAGGDAQKDIENLEGKHGADKAFLTYLELMSHVGAVGVYAHTMRGALHHSLLNSVAGPVIGSSAEFLQDTVSSLDNVYKHHAKHMSHDFRPVGRDLSYDIPGVSLGGQLLGHRLFPKKGEGRRHDPVRQLYDHITGQEN